MWKTKCRAAHPGHLNRVEQAWKEYLVPACICKPGKHWGKEIEVSIGHYNCFYCLEDGKENTVRMDTTGRAVCTVCGTIYNEGVPFPEKRKIDPMRGMHRFFKAIA